MPATRFFIRQYWESVDYELVVVNTSGQIISDSRSIDARLGFSPALINEDEKVKQVLKSEKSISWVERDSQNETIYYACPIFLENKIIGSAKFAMGTDDFAELFDVLRGYFLTTFILSLAAALLMALLFIKTLMKPVLNVRNMAVDIAGGNFGTRVNYTANDEIGDLSKNLNKMAESLNMLEQTRNSFLANVSHELRTPLTIIKGFAMTMQGDSTLSEENIHYVNTINKEADRLTRLVNELLELSRLRTGRFSLKLSKNSVKDLIDSVVFQMTPKSKEAGCRIIVEEPEKQENIYMDPDKMKEVLINLIDNALKYSITAGKECKVKIRYYFTEEEVDISVTDTGPGVSETEASQLFERFFRGGSRNHKADGVGLGLAIAKEIVEAHRGKITVESPGSGKGCIFTIKIPKELN